MPTFTKEDVEARALNARELLRADEVMKRGRVEDMRIDGSDLRVVVRGSDRRYDVRVTPGLDGSTCICMAFRIGARGFCKHIIAVALTWIGEVVDPAMIDTELAGAIELLSLFQARALLLQAAGRSALIRRRLINNTWSETPAPATPTRSAPLPIAPAVQRTKMAGRPTAPTRQWTKRTPLAPRKVRTRRDSSG